MSGRRPFVDRLVVAACAACEGCRLVWLEAGSGVEGERDLCTPSVGSAGPGP